MKLLLSILLFSTFMLSAQNAPLTKDSFFRPGTAFPKNYKEIIASGKWKVAATYYAYHERIVTSDTIYPITLELFDDGKVYRKIKGHTIVSNTDFGDVELVYVDEQVLISQSFEYKTKKRKKYPVRKLYVRAD